VKSYADAFRLLFEYSSGCTNTPPSQLQLEYIDAPLIVNFLNHLETTRGNSAGSRNIRLAAIKSFMSGAGLTCHRMQSSFATLGMLSS
jgi:integrase/recombinase XerD